MRKGRSQRKNRSSRVPVSNKARPLGGEAAAANVVVGHAPPSQEPGSIDPVTVETRADDAASSTKLELVPAGTLELVRESERLELVAPPTLELAKPSLELAKESAPTSSPDLATGETADDDAKDGAKDVHATSLPTPDEISIPPAGDLSVEPIAEEFFSQGDLSQLAGPSSHGGWDDDEDEEIGPPSKAKQKASPEVVQRRARFARYVTWAVGGAAVVCLAAFVRTIATPASAPASANAATPPIAANADAPAEKAAAPVAAPVAAPPPKADEPKPAAATPDPAKADEAKPAAASAELPKPAEAKADEKKADDAKPAEAKADEKPAASSGKTALEEKNDARRMLERGKLAEAIAAGERAVALDATDGEAWLLLGAAYQEKGAMADARRCYAACLKEGKRGPLGECRAMLR